ncbi:MAG: putative acyltransferase [Myxococcaceae bacterium]|nr:putative acyltransferase [Myxococcaceae bacterium]
MTAPGDDPLGARAPEVIAAVMPLARVLCRRYFRLRVEGLDRLPAGPALLVGNHNNGLAGPDIACTLSTLWDARGPDAPLYALAHDFAMRHVAVFGAVIARFGALAATRANARRALDAGAQVLVYPGGDLEAYRHFRRRDEVILGPRTGFVTLAQEAGVPIVPVVAQGAHRSAIVFHEGEAIARRLGLKRWARLERFPLALALPWGLAAGPWLPWLPLPFPIRLRFLAPLRVAPDDDPAEVRERVRGAMQSALDDMAGRR